MKMINKKLKTKLFGFFFGMWMAFTLTQPVTAQWTTWQVGDSSPTTFAQLNIIAAQLLTQNAQLTAQSAQLATQNAQLAAQGTIATATTGSKIAQALEYIQTANRWIAQVEQYTNLITSNIRRFTSLKGILQTVEKQLGLSDDTLKALADVGEIIRGAFTLKNNFLSLVRTRLRMLESLEARARDGIFNPRADLEDLEEYLRYSIGREAATRVATLERLKETDVLLERLTYELGQVRAKRVAKQEELHNINIQLGREGSLATRPRVAGVDSEGSSTTVFDSSRQSLSAEAVQTLTLRAGQLEEQIESLIAREQELVNQIAERFEEIQGVYDSAYLKGNYWTSVMNGWKDFDIIQTEELENLVDIYGRTPSPAGTPLPPSR
jgi:hypothetical protein